MSAALAALEAQLRRLTDRSDLHDLIDRYMITLDEGKFDDAWTRSLFTADVSLTFPVGGYQGLAGLAEFTAEFMGRWDRTHHHAANHVIDVAGDRAAVSWSMIATHLRADQPSGPHFQLGAHFDGAAVRTGAGWRFSGLVLRVVWTSGRPAAEVSETSNS